MHEYSGGSIVDSHDWVGAAAHCHCQASWKSTLLIIASHWKDQNWIYWSDFGLQKHTGFKCTSQ